MRRKRALKRGRVVPLLVAGGIGYLLGGWHVTGPHGSDLSASQSVASRFPQDWDNAQPVQAGYHGKQNAMVMGDAQLALLSPAPMVQQTSVQQTSASPAPLSQTSVPQAAAAPASIPAALAQTAALEAVSPSPAAYVAPAQPAPSATLNVRETKPAQTAGEIKSAAAAAHRRTERPGYVLNDAQIVSIKQRLNLTPDQERMWPAVEAALRNLAYTNARVAHRSGSSGSATQLASADPNSTEVQDFKAAAIPLIMSFNSEQKDEVRSLAHVMGLDQLASQF
jgi:hypothetical protein